MSKLAIKDIAEALNLSTSTVSRALNNKGRISPQTKEKIYQFIKENDGDSPYIQFQQKRRMVGIVVGKLNNEFFAKIIESLQTKLATRDISLVVTYANYSYEIERQSILSLVEDRVDCIVSLATKHPTVLRKELCQIPLITIDQCNPLIDDVPDYRIISDQYVGGVLATEELIQKGCRRIAYFTNIGVAQTDYKYKGLCDTLKKYGMEPDENLYVTSGTRSNNSIEDARMTVEYLLAKDIQFDGVFATSDRRALGVMLALNEHHITYPDEVKIVGYDASSLSESFKITSIFQDVESIANNCFYYVLTLLGEKTSGYSLHSPIPVFLIRGQTT